MAIVKFIISIILVGIMGFFAILLCIIASAKRHYLWKISNESRNEDTNRATKDR